MPVLSRSRVDWSRVTDSPAPEQWLVAAMAAHRGELQRYLRALVGDDDLARDILQEGYLRLAGHDPAAVRNPRALLYRVVSNLAHDHLRRRHREAALPADPDGEVPPVVDEMIAGEDLASLRAAMAALPDRCGRVLRLHKLEGASYRDIARRLGISERTVGNHLAYAMRLLRLRLAGRDATDNGSGGRP